jgi:hypothetical protein
MESFAKSQNVMEDIYAERRRQVDSEGWTPEHDDSHSRGELARAAASYAYAGSVTTGRKAILGQPESGTDFHLRLWPWDWKWWKPTNRRRDLVKAAALIVAEIERLDRSNTPAT